MVEQEGNWENKQEKKMPYSIMIIEGQETSVLIDNHQNLNKLII